VEESKQSAGEGFEDLAWIFTCDSRNRGLIRQGFNEAALLWKAVKATSGNILEVGRNLAGSTVLLAAAAGPPRNIYSIDNRSNEDRACKDYLARPEHKAKADGQPDRQQISLEEPHRGWIPRGAVFYVAVPHNGRARRFLKIVTREEVENLFRA